MSLFLGKIHFWLFEKIKWFEGLEEDTLALAKANSIDIDKLVKEANERFGEKLKDEPLDKLIDESNIHGWLQEAINSAEGRVAFYTTEILKANEGLKANLLEIYINKGIENAKSYIENNSNVESAEEIYKAMNDYILEGMPCDRINQILSSSEDKIEWSAQRCLHKVFWDKVGGDVSNFYELRNAWIKSFVNALNKNFVYEINNNIMSISKMM